MNAKPGERVREGRGRLGAMGRQINVNRMNIERNEIEAEYPLQAEVGLKTVIKLDEDFFNSTAGSTVPRWG